MKSKYTTAILLIITAIRMTSGIASGSENFNPNVRNNIILLTVPPGTSGENPMPALPLAAVAYTNTTYYSPVDPSTRSLNTSYLAGSTNGALSVNQAGSAVYTIPIEVLPGANGQAPALSLVYSGNSGYGVAGYGWHIGGISIIGRSGKNFYNDSTFTGINLSANDKFTLDGQRLVLTGGTYGADQAGYQTEEDIFSSVQSLGVLGSGPEKFIVKTKTGIENQYGYTSAGKQQIPGYSEVVNWYITQSSDLYGNLISYAYLKDNNMVYPSEINYGPNKITFFYSTRTDVTSSYLKGQKIQQTLLLDRITVAYNNNIVRTYELKYNLTTDNYNSYSVLNEVIEYGTGSGRLNSTVFSYQTPANVSITQSNHYTNYDKISFPSLIYSGDFNGDGKADLLCLANAGGSMLSISGAQVSSAEGQALSSDPVNPALIPLVVPWTGMKMYYGDGNDNFSNLVSSDNIIDTGKLDDFTIHMASGY